MSVGSVFILIVFVLCTEGVGGLGALATSGNISTWYATLAKPSFSPPNTIFAPVWTTLYALMGVSLFMIWRKRKHHHIGGAVKLFGIQLFLNGIWSPVFFGWHQLGWGLVIIVAMLIAIIATIISFKKIDRTAALLLVPYLMWVSFATLLNFSLWRLN